MRSSTTDLLKDVARYYSSKFAIYGESPAGVDWNGEEGQTMRFAQLTKIIAPSARFTINDLGCGYGALLGYLRRYYRNFSYCGIDVSPDMIRAAEQRYGNTPQVRFLLSSEPHQVADYGVASGIFNVRVGRSDSEWEAYVESALDILDRSSRSGFGFNCLTSYSDSDKMRDHLYYADPGRLFHLCQRRYSRHVALLHDYGLYEFTILVRKQP